MARSRRPFGAIRRLPSKRHQASYIGPDGAKHLAHSTFLRKSDAEAWLSDEERLIDEGRWTPPEERRPNSRAGGATITVESYVRDNIQRRSTRLRRPLKPSTVTSYLQGQRLVVFPELGDIELGKLTPADIHKWWTGLPDNPTQNGNAYDILRSVLEDAVTEKLIPENPCRVKGAGKPAPKRKARIITPDVVEAYLAAAEDRYRPVLGILLWCSQRSGEVRALRRCDVADDGTQVAVEQGVTRPAEETEDGRGVSRWHIDTPKTAAGRRSVAVPPIIVADVKAAVDRHDATGRGPNDLLFPALDGVTPMHDNTLRKAHRRALVAVGLEGVTLHDLRRSGATIAGRSGATIKELMRRLGHTRSDVAMLYQVADDERDRIIADRMAELVTSRAGAAKWWTVQATVAGEVVVLEVQAATIPEAVSRACVELGAVDALTVEATEAKVLEAEVVAIEA